MKTLQFSSLICAIWCTLFGNIPKRRKNHHLDDSPFSDNLNRIDKVQLWQIRFNNWTKYRSLILTYQPVLCHHVFSGLFCFFLSSCFFLFSFVLFLAFFSPPSFHVFYNLLTVLRGCFNRRNTSFSLAPRPFLSFFSSFLSPLFSFFPSSFLFLFFPSPCRFLVRRPPPCRTASDRPAYMSTGAKKFPDFPS